MFAKPRKAATIAIVRRGFPEPEVLMMKRGASDRFLPSFYVFPGGAVDPQDKYAGEMPVNLYTGITSPDERNSLITHIIAGIREAFEEAGILLARDSKGFIPESDESMFSAFRKQVFRGELKFSDFLEDQGLVPAFDCLHYLERWITPVYSPIRYDARFFAALCPGNQHVSHDGDELVESLWITPREALKMHKSGKMRMVLPTSETLVFLSRFNTADELFSSLEQKEKDSPLKSF
ncbi:MAG TPA: hypothetical protein PK514_10400 [Spirochaetota bacterium]|nr:hypothetical protein [Spirochaetota bacterium]